MGRDFMHGVFLTFRQRRQVMSKEIVTDSGDTGVIWVEWGRSRMRVSVAGHAMLDLPQGVGQSWG